MFATLLLRCSAAISRPRPSELMAISTACEEKYGRGGIIGVPLRTASAPARMERGEREREESGERGKEVERTGSEQVRAYVRWLRRCLCDISFFLSFSPANTAPSSVSPRARRREGWDGTCCWRRGWSLSLMIVRVGGRDDALCEGMMCVCMYVCATPHDGRAGTIGYDHHCCIWLCSDLLCRAWDLHYPHGVFPFLSCSAGVLFSFSLLIILW